MDENQKRTLLAFEDPEDREPTEKVETARCPRHSRIFLTSEGCERCVQEEEEAAFLVALKARKVAP